MCKIIFKLRFFCKCWITLFAPFSTRTPCERMVLDNIAWDHDGGDDCENGNDDDNGYDESDDDVDGEGDVNTDVDDRDDYDDGKITTTTIKTMMMLWQYGLDYKLLDLTNRDISSPTRHEMESHKNKKMNI
jgi:hypothetical protein